jgi:hypothetical protein
MLIGRGLRGCPVEARFTTNTPEFIVELDIALPGRDVLTLLGVASPDLEPDFI